MAMSRGWSVFLDESGVVEKKIGQVVVELSLPVVEYKNRGTL
jgi:hypothetical protein